MKRLKLEGVFHQGLARHCVLRPGGRSVRQQSQQHALLGQPQQAAAVQQPVRPRNHRLRARAPVLPRSDRRHSLLDSSRYGESRPGSRIPVLCTRLPACSYADELDEILREETTPHYCTACEHVVKEARNSLWRSGPPVTATPPGPAAQRSRAPSAAGC